MNYWIDTHSHFALDSFQEQFDTYMQRCHDAQVGKIVCICMNQQEWNLMTKHQKKYPNLYLAYGYHPEDIQKLEEDDWNFLHQVAHDPRCVAIGEIGLDYYWDKSYNDFQKECFIRQIQLANEVHKPILVHSRDAAQDTLDLLKRYTPVAGGIMHCYGGSVEMAKEYIKLGMYLSFGGPLTFKNAVKPKEVVCDTDVSHLFIETDCPYMSPVPVRGNMNNESSYVHYIGECMAELKGCSIESLQQQQIDNFNRLFKE